LTVKASLGEAFYVSLQKWDSKLLHPVVRKGWDGIKVFSVRRFLVRTIAVLVNRKIASHPPQTIKVMSNKDDHKDAHNRQVSLGHILGH